MPANLSDAMKAAGRIPSAPGVAVRLVRLTRCEEVSAHALAELIGLDPALSAQLLKAANSAPLRERQAIGSLAQAAQRVGVGGLKALALSSSPLATVSDAVPPEFDLVRYWLQSLARALAASAIAEETQNVAPEEAYAAGLLCGFGRLVLATTYASEYQRVLKRAAECGCGLSQAEVGVLGTTQSNLAAQLFEAWQFPQWLCEACTALSNVDPMRSIAQPARVLIEADRMAQALCVSSPNLAPEVCNASLGIDSNRWRELCDEVSLRWRKWRQLLEIPANTAVALEAIDAEARERLAELAVTTQLQLRALAQRQDALLRQARRDPLTEVGNRPAFDERLALELDRAQRTQRPVLLLLADVDHFKAVNDRYGHAAGDEVLRRVSRAINDATRRVDLVARLGGDEFAVIAPECTLEGAGKLAERLRMAVERTPIDGKGQRVAVTISVGAALAQWPQHPTTPGALFAAADEQLYAAKHAGRNCSRVCGGAQVGPHPVRGHITQRTAVR